MKLVAIERVMRGLARAPKPENAWRSPRPTLGPALGHFAEPGAVVLAPAHAEFIEARSLARRAAEQAMNLIAPGRGTFRAAPAEDSNVWRFLAWAQKACADERAKAAGTLARAYLCSDLPRHLQGRARTGRCDRLSDLRRDAEVCLTTMVKDKSPLVRRALAEALADAHDAPRHIVSALANDEPEIAAVMLARSPLLSNDELVECAAVGGEIAQMALARRPNLNADVAASLVEADGREVSMALIENAGARLAPDVMRRVAERFSEDGAMRDALLARPELPAILRYDLFTAAARALPSFAAPELGEERIERMMRDACERCAILAADSCRSDEIGDLMRHLRATGVLTAALLVRALISGSRSFFAAAAAELSGVSPERIAGFLREPFGPGFLALYRRMGLPQQFLAPFRVAVAALDEFRGDADRMVRPIVSRVIACCENEGSSGLSGLLPLLRRLEADAALEEACAVVEQAAQRAAALFREENAFAAPIVAIEPGLCRLLSLLRKVEAEAALAELEAAVPSFARPREIFEDASLAA